MAKNIEMNYLNSNGEYEKIIPSVTAKDESCYLKSNTASMYGLGQDATPDEIFSWIGKYNQYWWKRRSNYYTYTYEVTSNTVCGDPYSVGGFIYYMWKNSDTNTFQYSNTMGANETSIYLIGPSTLTVNAYSFGTTQQDILKGKFIYDPQHSQYYKAANEITSGTSDGYLAIGPLYYVKHVSVNNYGPYEYITSLNSGQYPQSGIQGGYEYTYLGKPFEKIIEL